ncbi:MAG: hypothetical protein M3Z09_00245 [Acidobacteriota bacterium]|nr:hypothetical protein [Acidobacteriota bacterium]
MRDAAVLFLINAYVSWRVFGLEYSRHMDSIEGAYLAISRHILASFPDLSWWPAWYGGIPFHNSYPPLLHALVALASAVTSLSVARAHHIVTALFYCLGPVFAYLMLRRLSGRPFQSFCAALLYTVLSPSGLLVKAVRLDMGHPLRPRRLGTLIGYGDGPHLAALALVPLAIYCVDLAFERRRPLYYGLAALSIAAVVLINWLGAFALAALLLCYLAAGRPWRDWLTTAVLGIAAYLLVSPVMPPSLIRTIQFNAKTIGGDFTSANANLLRAAPFALAAFLLLKLILHRFRAPAYLQMLILFTAVMSWISLSYSWFRVAVVPQPERYLLEMDLGLTLLAVMLVPAMPKRIAQAAVVLLFLFSAGQLYRGQRYARGLISPVDIATTVEYRVARWCNQNLRNARVMVPGSIAFFFNAFTETPQILGGFENGVVNYSVRIAQYQILSGAGTTINDVPVSLLWLKAFAIQAIEAGGPATREYYHPFVNGDKFRGVLPELWREGADAIYQVPLRSPSLAHIMTPAQLVVHPPVNGLDLTELRRYVEALDDPALPEARFLWRSQHSAEVLADFEPGQVASIQITYTPGWHAFVGNSPARIIPDGLGFFAVAPDCTGRRRVELVYDGGREEHIAHWASAAVLLCWLVWMAASFLWPRGPSTGFWGIRKRFSIRSAARA